VNRPGFSEGGRDAAGGGNDDDQHVALGRG
jgi:hypothetical protein